MEGLLLRGLLDLFTEYTSILESALTNQTEIEEVDSRINIAESVEQQVSLISNLSKLSQFFSSMIRRAFCDTYHLEFEIDNCELFINDNFSRLRSQFCKQLILKSWPLDSEHSCSTDLQPSISYQVCFPCDLKYFVLFFVYTPLKKALIRITKTISLCHLSSISNYSKLLTRNCISR